MELNIRLHDKEKRDFHALSKNNNSRSKRSSEIWFEPTTFSDNMYQSQPVNRGGGPDYILFAVIHWDRDIRIVTLARCGGRYRAGQTEQHPFD